MPPYVGPKPCIIDGCDRIARPGDRGMCRMHITRVRRGAKNQFALAPKACLQCGAPLGKNDKYCSHTCQCRYLRGTPEQRTCIVCGKAYPTWHRGTVCSSECKKQNMQINGHRRRARLRGTASEKFDPVEIFERDGWVCQICNEPVDRTVWRRHRQAASLDHVLPIAKGGAHTRANTQCAHLWCNFKKHTRTMEQMRHVA